MRKFSNLLFASICALSLLASCSGKDGDPGPAGPAGATGATGGTGPSGQNLAGTIYGFVNSTDENSGAANKAGVTVALEGATTQTATTDANGRFEFLNVRNGTYNLTYTRAGYATFRRFGISHVGGDQPTFLGLNTITQISSTLVTNLAVGTPNPTSVPLSFTLANPNPSNSTYRVSFFASNISGVTAATGTLLTTFVLNSAGSTTINLSRTTLINAGLASGTTVYLVAYGSPVALTSYIDPMTGRVVYPSLNPMPSNVVSFIL